MTRTRSGRRSSRRDDQQYVDFVVASQQRLRRTAYLLTGDWQLAADVAQHPAGKQEGAGTTARRRMLA